MNFKSINLEGLKHVLKFKYVFFFLVAYKILLTFQGFEVCDSGWYATFYQYIFKDPSLVEYNLLYWLTGIVGGSVMLIFSDLGLWGVRLLGVISTALTIYAVYIFLNKRFSLFAINLGLIVVVVSMTGHPQEFFHNGLTSLLYVLSCILLLDGISKENKYSIFVAGILCALSIFARLPNILIVGFIFLICLYGVYAGRSYFVVLKNISVYFISIIISIVLVLCVMYALGHLEIYINNIYGLLDVASGRTENTHSIKNLLIINVKAYFKVLKDGAIFSVFIVLLYMINKTRCFSDKRFIKGVFYLIVISGSVLVYDNISLLRLLYFISIVTHLFAFYVFDAERKIIVLMSMYMLMVLPLGSDGGIYNFGHFALWLSVPISFDVIYKLFSMKNDVIQNKRLIWVNKYVDYHSVNKFMYLLLIVFILKSVYVGVNYCYFDPGSRVNKVYAIDNEKLKCIYTTKKNANIMNDMLSNLKKYVKKGDYLIAYESIPMIYYITDTRPFLHDSWLISSASSPLDVSISRVLKEGRQLPVILRQKFQTIGGFGDPSEEYISNNGDDRLYVSNKRTKIFNNFIAENNYELVWSNLYFNIYITKGHL